MLLTSTSLQAVSLNIYFKSFNGKHSIFMYQVYKSQIK